MKISFQMPLSVVPLAVHDQSLLRGPESKPPLIRGVDAFKNHGNLMILLQAGLSGLLNSKNL